MKTIDLGGDWQIRSACGTYQLTGTVPGSLFADLEKSGTFGAEGLFWRENNRQCTDIAGRDFIFSREITIAPAFLHGPDSGLVYLEADGLDTLATLSINGQEIGVTDNMHRRWEFEVGSLLKAGTNRIEIRFADALDHCRRELERRKVWFAYEPTPEIAWPGFNMIRKSHCSFGWDWGPIVPDVGIWRPIRLAARGPARVAELRVLQHHSPSPTGTAVRLDIQANLEWLSEGAYHRAPARGGIGNAFRQVLDAALGTGIKAGGTLHLPDGSSREFAVAEDGSAQIEIPDARLWWPAGLGEQPLYSVEISLESRQGTIHSRRLDIGLRTITVRREPDQWGESFEFVVNGLPVFARGADYIPEDVALTRGGRERTERLILDSVRANFNCLRVWGGGVYPGEDFWQLCDRHGLIVWMDLMYACALYDISHPPLRETMLAEVRDNLLRIRHHASLGLVCGNNEMEQAFVDWNLPQEPRLKTEYLLQYQHLFPAIAQEVCPEVYYWPASPSSGGDFDQPNAPDRGDCHFWEVWHGNKDYSEFTKHYFRFMSEFGFESFPAMKTIESFTLPADRNPFSPVMEDHQRCVGGNGKIMNYVSRYFRYPTSFAGVVQVSQISQAEALRHGIEHWRRNRGRCMGSVYWQLNDNWPVASWSSIDYFGRWKALHYEARRAYAPLLVSTVSPDPESLDPAIRVTLRLPEGNGHFRPQPAIVDLHLSNESREAAAGTLVWELLDMAGAVLEKGSLPVSTPAFTSSSQARLDFSARVNGLDRPRNCLFCWHAVLENGLDLHGFHAFVPYKQLELGTARIEARVVEMTVDGSPGLAIELNADRPALFATVDHRDLDLVLSDNCIPLDGHTSRRLVVVECRREGRAVQVSAAELAGGLTVTSLADTY